MSFAISINSKNRVVWFFKQSIARGLKVFGELAFSPRTIYRPKLYYNADFILCTPADLSRTATHQHLLVVDVTFNYLVVFIYGFESIINRVGGIFTFIYFDIWVLYSIFDIDINKMLGFILYKYFLPALWRRTWYSKILVIF